MKDTIYLVVSRDGVQRMHKRMPETGPGQHVVGVIVKIPDTVFSSKSPPMVTLEIPEPKPLSGGDVEMEIQF